jgi:hypothetical protein
MAFCRWFIRCRQLSGPIVKGRRPKGRKPWTGARSPTIPIALAGRAVIEEPPNYWENGSSERAETDRCGILCGAKGWGYNRKQRRRGRMTSKTYQVKMIRKKKRKAHKENRKVDQKRMLKNEQVLAKLAEQD